MIVPMKNPKTGFVWPIHAPLDGISPIRRLYFMRFWFAGYLALKNHRSLGVFGLLIVIAVPVSLAVGYPSVAACLGLLYGAMGLYFGPKIPKLQAQHYLDKGWEFAEPDSEATRKARRLWNLDDHTQDQPKSPLRKRGSTIGLVLIGCLIGIGSYAFSKPSVASLTKNLDQAVATNAQSWFFNKYDPGSLNHVQVVRSDGLFAEIVQADYTFNSGTPGWLLARVKLGRVECLQYWDKNFCAPVDPSESAAPAVATVNAPKSTDSGDGLLHCITNTGLVGEACKQAGVGIEADDHTEQTEAPAEPPPSEPPSASSNPD